MVISWRSLLIEWRLGLERAEAAAADETAGSAWYWTIRARVLRYLLSRYEQQAGRLGAPPRDEPPARRPPIVRMLVDHPPKGRDRIAATLVELGDAAEEARVRRRGEPDEPWLWYRNWLDPDGPRG